VSTARDRHVDGVLRDILRNADLARPVPRMPEWSLPKPEQRSRLAMVVAVGVPLLLVGAVALSLLTLSAADHGRVSPAGSATSSTSSATARANPAGTPSIQVAPPPTFGPSLPANPKVGVAYPFRLFTHCGIRSMPVGAALWYANPQLGDINPPPGWGNPFDDGTVTFTSSTTAVFSDPRGNRASFVPQIPGGHPSAFPCF
jgi:hypothetical protein